MDTGAALDWFDSLPPVTCDAMIGSWRGSGVPTGHPLDGLLESAGWHGKRFIDAETVDPLMMTGLGRTTHPINPALLPLGLVAGLPARDRIVPWIMPLLRPFLTTSNPRARLRTMDYRGVATATMVYDAKPINDHFRRIDASSVLGAMDQRGMARPFFFRLDRED